MLTKYLLLSAPLLTACMTDTEPALDESTHEINGPDVGPASQFQLDRAVKIPGCTATRISARWAITAAHCMPSVEDDVSFYTTGPGTASSETAEIAEVVLRPGVSALACNADIANCWDSTGDFADIALIRLKSHSSTLDEDDLDGHHATLAWQYPGDGSLGKKVGAGGHDGNPNPDDVLLQHADTLQSTTDNDGKFLSTDDHTDGGDSGGPFYYQNKIVGTLYGSGYVPFDHFNIYTSVPEHLKWILTTIGYRWRGQPPQPSTQYAGTVIEDFHGNEQECQYVCDKLASCDAYNFTTNPPVHAGDPNCILYDNPTSVTTASGWTGALKHGARQGNSNQAVGYVRGDGLDAVVHVSTGNRIHELVRVAGQWEWFDIQGTAPSVMIGGKLSAYRRADGTSAIVYRSTSAHIIELALTPAGWRSFDLTSITGAELAAGSPTAYVKADGVSAVVYRGTSGRIIELRLGSRSWVKRDLTAASGSATTAASDPSAFVRADGYSSVVFRSSGDAIMELVQPIGGGWIMGSPSAVAGAPAATGRPFGYTFSNGVNAIVYRTSAGQVIQMVLMNGQWSDVQLATGATGDVTAYTRTDLVEAVMFRSSANKIVEVANLMTTNDLTVVTSAPLAAGSPAVYHRNDGYNVVLFETSSNHVHELYLKRGGTWGAADLTAVAGETP